MGISLFQGAPHFQVRTDSFREGKALETKKQSATGRGKDTRNHDKAW